MYIFPSNFKPQLRGLGSYLLSGPGRHRRRRGMRGMGQDASSGYSDPITGEWIDTSGQAAAGAIGPGIQPTYTNVSNLPLAPANPNEPLTALTTPYNTGMIAAGTPLAPAGQNYSSAIASFFNPSPAQAAQMALPTSGISSGTLLLLGAAAVGFMLISGGGGKRRR